MVYRFVWPNVMHGTAVGSLAQKKHQHSVMASRWVHAIFCRVAKQPAGHYYGKTEGIHGHQFLQSEWC